MFRCESKEYEVAGLSSEIIEEVRVRLARRYPGRDAEVTRQLNLASACAEHLNVTVTAQELEKILTDSLDARTGGRSSGLFRSAPAVYQGRPANKPRLPSLG